MALTLARPRVQAGSIASAATVAATYGSATAGGNTLVALVSHNNAAGTINATSLGDDVGNTWLLAGSEFSTSAGADSNGLSIWYCQNATANAGTVTANFSAACLYRAIVLYEVSGAATVSPLNTTSTGSAGSGTAISTGTFTLVAASEIIFAIAIQTDGPESITPGTGYTGVNFAISGDANTYFLDEYHIVSSGEAATATISGSAPWAILAASFKAAAGGGGPTYTLALGQGAYTLTGQALATKAARKLALAQGSYALTGQALGLKAGRKLVLGQGSYVLTGQNLALKAARKMVLGQGAYTLTGQSLTLVYTPVGGPTHTLVLGQGSYTLTGQALALKASRKLALGQGSYVLTGESLAIRAGRKLVLGQGTYVLTGQAMTFKAARKMTLGTGSYVLTGKDLTITQHGAATEYLLPKAHYNRAARNHYYLFYMESGDGIRLRAINGDTIKIAAGTSARNGAITSTTPGSFVRLGARANGRGWIAVTEYPLPPVAAAAWSIGA